MLSVVIRSRNEERYIGHCIQSVTDFIGKPEIVIVDNESTDNTIPIINRFEYHDIEKITIPKNDYTPGKSLNLGVKNCTEDYVMILSAHCEVVKFDFDRVKEQLDRNGVGAVWGKQTPIWDGKKYQEGICGLTLEMNHKQIIGVNQRIGIFSIMHSLCLGENI